MPEQLNRDQLEAELAKALGSKFAKQRKELIELLGDPPSLENVPEAYWNNGGKQLRGVVVPVLMSIYDKTANALMTELSIGVEWGVINEAAAAWAEQYAYELVTGIEKTTRAGLQRAISRYYRDDLTIGELASDISRYYSPVRAEMIAVTEVTRAAVEGERGVVEQIMKDNANILMRPYWQTNNDERVCPVCGPKHNKEITDGVYPPAHPRCRCWVNWKASLRDG